VVSLPTPINFHSWSLWMFAVDNVEDSSSLLLMSELLLIALMSTPPLLASLPKLEPKMSQSPPTVNSEMLLFSTSILCTMEPHYNSMLRLSLFHHHSSLITQLSELLPWKLIHPIFLQLTSLFMLLDGETLQLMELTHPILCWLLIFLISI